MLNSNQQHEQHDEEEQEQEEEEDEFHESLDRLLSSASSSTSDDDADSFPPFSADLWNSSIQDRRRRLLMHFGLSPDPSRSDSNPDPKPIPKPKPPCTNLHNQRSFHRHRPSLGLPPISRPPEFARHRSTSVTAIDFEDAVTIKNLDNGTEFIVKEVREDGTWKKLREVETGRQLSMEEFELSVGTSPIVQELMRRQNKEEQQDEQLSRSSSSGSSNVSSKKRGGWLSFRNSFKKSQQEGEMHGVARAKVGKCGKSEKDLSGLVMSQQIKAHSGAIWSVKFSVDGKHLASAGEDCVIHVWKVNESEKKEGLDRNRFLSSPDLVLGKGCGDEGYWERRRRMKVVGRRSLSSADQLMVPEYVFGLSEEPVCSFRGHGDDVLDLSWSKSQYLLSSSMDKTVRLWHLSSKSCLKTFSHSDYVTCIQFNPVDDRYFISGSLDEKVRLWSIPDRQIVDWNDLHEMITAACYSPDGQTALVGSHKGSCHLYNTSENKLLRKSQIDLKNKKKKSSPKKITGFQFAPGKSSEVIITSADSRIRFIDGVELVHKFKGFRNTSSQISACFTANGKYVICASEDSRVYVWRYEPRDSRSNRSKGSISVTQSYEHFHCQDVTVAVPWPGTSTDRISVGHHAPSFPPYGGNVIINTHNSHFSDKLAATWPEEKLLISARNYLPQGSGDIVLQSRPAWGMVIVAAGRGGEIRTFQNFGFPI